MSGCKSFLLFMIKVWTELNTALFSSSFRLTEPKISRFSEIVSGMSKSEKKSCCLESCDADNLIRNEIQFQLFHRYNLAIQQGF